MGSDTGVGGGTEGVLGGSAVVGPGSVIFGVQEVTVIGGRGVIDSSGYFMMEGGGGGIMGGGGSLMVTVLVVRPSVVYSSASTEELALNVSSSISEIELLSNRWLLSVFILLFLVDSYEIKKYMNLYQFKVTC